MGGWGFSVKGMRVEKEWRLPVAGETLRAPAFWILGPLLLGVAVYGWMVPVGQPWIYAAVGALAFAGALGTTRFRIALIWIALGGFALGLGTGAEIRAPAEVWDWKDLPPREVTVDLQLSRVQEREHGDFFGFSGSGTVVAAPDVVSEVVGRRVWFGGTMEDRGQVPERGATVRVRGVLSGYAGATGGFEEGLFQSGYCFGIGRMVVLENLEPPGPWARFLNRLAERVQWSLRQGVQGENGYSALQTSIMLGWKHLVDPEIREQFRITGVIHVMAVSGLHVGMVLVVVWRIARLARFGPRGSLCIGLGVSLLHVLVTGAPPSAVRAYMMAVILSLGPLFGRRYDPVSAITVSALLVAVCFPHQVVSVGFHLSYLVVGAIVLWAMPVLQWMDGVRQRMEDPRMPVDGDLEREIGILRRLRGAVFWIVGLFVVGLAAFVVSVPLTIDDFGTLPWMALLVNPIVVPLASIVMLQGVLSVGFGLIGLGWVSGFINHGAWVCLAAMEGIVGWAAVHGWNRTGIGFPFQGEGLLISAGILVLMVAVPPVQEGRLRGWALVPLIAGLGSVLLAS